MQRAVQKVIVNEWNVTLIYKSTIFVSLARSWIVSSAIIWKLKRSKQAFLEFQSKITKIAKIAKKGRPIDQSEWREEYLVLVRNKFALYFTSHDSPSCTTPPRGGTPDFKWQGWSNGGKNQNRKKSLEQNLKENPMPSFRAKKIPESIIWYNTKNGNISFEYPKNPFLNQATKKILAKIFPSQKIPKWFCLIFYQFLPTTSVGNE